jgi:hypothetical protein
MAPVLAWTFFIVPSRSARSMFCHLHGFDYRERLTGLDLLHLGHRDRDQEAGHGAEQLLASAT